MTQPNSDSSRYVKCAHTARLYDSAAGLVTHVADAAAAALQSQAAAVLIAVPEHSRDVCTDLAARGLEIEKLLESGQLIVRDARQILSTITSHLHPDRATFEALARGLLEQANCFAAPPLIYGELVDLLWQQDNLDAARELEHWWNVLGRQFRFDLLCGYKVDPLDDDAQDALDAICGTHESVVMGPETERSERAIRAGFRDVFPYADFEIVQQDLAAHCRCTRVTPAAHAAMIGLRAILPSVAHLVRLESRKHLSRVS